MANLKPGEYSVKVVLEGNYRVDEEDEQDEDDLVDRCRRKGEMTDWSVEFNG